MRCVTDYVGELGLNGERVTIPSSENRYCTIKLLVHNVHVIHVYLAPALAPGVDKTPVTSSREDLSVDSIIYRDAMSENKLMKYHQARLVPFEKINVSPTFE